MCVCVRGGIGALVKGRGVALEKRRNSFMAAFSRGKGEEHTALCHFSHLTVSSNTPPTLCSLTSSTPPSHQQVQALAQEGRVMGLRWLHTLPGAKARQTCFCQESQNIRVKRNLADH